MLMPPGPQRWIGFGFRKLILIVEGKKDGLDEDQMKNRQVGREAPERFWRGVKGGLHSSQGGRESHGGQIWAIQNTAQIETSKQLDEVGAEVKEESLFELSGSSLEWTEMELTGIGNTRLYGAENWGAWGAEARGVTIRALKQWMKWAPPLCPVLAPRSFLAKTETENSYAYFNNLVWKK